MARTSRKKGKADSLENKTDYLEKIFRSGVYVRLSSIEMNSVTNCKLDNQEEVIKNYVKDHPDIQIVKVYRDNGFTGTNFERDSFLEMLGDIKAGLIDCVIVKDLSRLGRNHIEAEQYISVIFPFMNVRFIAVNDNFDSYNSDSDLTISLKNIINDAYAKDISRKIFSAKQTQRRNGEFVGNIPPYGYEKSKSDPHKLVPNAETQEVIKFIFDKKEQGMTHTEIARILNNRDEIAPMTYWYRQGKLHHEKYANRVWEATTIKVILGNQMYVGDMVQGKKQKCLAEGRTKVKAQSPEQYVIVPNMHDALVTRTQFERVQEICKAELEKNRQKRYKHKEVAITDNILENKISSKEGLKMYRSRNVYENYVAYNFVTVKTRKPDGSYFPFSYISEKKVFAALEKAMYLYIEMLFTVKEFCSSLENKSRYKEGHQKRAKEVWELETCISRYSERLAALYIDMSEGIISITEYQELRSEYQEKKRKAQNQLNNMRKEEKMFQSMWTGRAYMKEYKEFLQKRELTKTLIDILVQKIIVVGKSEVEIVFCFEDEVKELYERMKVG
ncbi:MAG: recombinase family protein [Lachnospiraceae bacterium]